MSNDDYIENNNYLLENYDISKKFSFLNLIYQSINNSMCKKRCTLSNIYLNDIKIDNILNFPIKLQLYLIIRHSNLDNEMINHLKCLLHEYDPIKNNVDDEIIIKMMEGYEYYTNGIMCDINIYHMFVITDYVSFWKNVLKILMSLTETNACMFKIIMIMCEKFNISLTPSYIRQLINCSDYSEDMGIYLLKSKKLKFCIGQNMNNNTKSLMMALHLMFVHAVSLKYNILAKIICSIPNFMYYVPENQIKFIILQYPGALKYNMTDELPVFNLVDSTNNIASAQLCALSYDENLKSFSATNKIISVMLENKLTVENDEYTNIVFYNYLSKLISEINEEYCDYIEYNENINYSEKLLDVHLNIISTPIIN